MQRIDHIVIHCSATPSDREIDVDTIRSWHVDDNGWSDVGYHFVIARDGQLQGGRPIHKSGAHVKGHNRHSLGVCLVGGLDAHGNPDDNFTAAQYSTLTRLVSGMSIIFPNAEVLGHRDFPDVNKDCPCFDVKEWLEHAG